MVSSREVCRIPPRHSMSTHSSEYNDSVRTFRKLHRRWREARMFASAIASTDHPILAQIVPIRRCNLSCTYCNEFDKTSEPVPVSVMMRRIDRLAELGTSIINFSGGGAHPPPRP